MRRIPSALRRRLHGRGERGWVTLTVSVVVLGLFAVVGLVFDGARKVEALQRLDNVAAEAARAAGQHISGADLDGGLGLNRAAAVAAARNYLAAAGVAGTVDISGDTITVNTSGTEETVFLELVGVPSFNVTGSATVQITTGL